MNISIKDKFAKAKVHLVISSPFFSSILLKRDLVERKDLPTMAVDKEGNILYNPDFVEQLSVDTLTFVLAHESMHVALAHLHRLQNRDPELWNIACDAVINEILIKAGVGKFLEGGIRMEGADERTAESIYAELLNQKHQQQQGQGQGDGEGSGSGGGSGSLSGGSNGHGSGQSSSKLTVKDILPELANGITESDAKQAERDGKMDMSQALQGMRMRGKGAGQYLEGILGKLIESSVPWYELLERYMTSKSERHQTWNRPNRRMMQTAYLPRRERYTHMGKVLVAVDVSGSISNEEVCEAFGHITRICEQCRPEKVEVIMVTSAVEDKFEYTPDEYPIQPPTHRYCGGTNMCEVARWVEKSDEKPEIAIVITDGLTPFPDSCECELLWVIKYPGASRNRFNVPFGEVLMME